MDDRLPQRLFGPASFLGVLGGAATAASQHFLLRFGEIAGIQVAILWAFCLLLGASLGGVGLAAGAALRRMRWVRTGRIITFLLPAAGLIVFALVNPRSRPDVLLLVTDATRADHLSLYGYERDTTPFLRGLAEASITFDNMMSQGSHTIVSTPSILASRFPSEHGLRNYDDVLADRVALLPELLKAAGYRTFGCATNPHLGPRNGFDQGYDKYEYEPRWTAASAVHVNEGVLDWLGTLHKQPAFAFAFYIDTHSPYSPPPPFDRMFDTTWDGPPIAQAANENVRPPAGELRNLVAQYDGEIAYWDSELRELVAGLRERNRWNETLLVYTSDHGEEFYEHGHWGHNRTLYQESTHVPLLFSLPPPLHVPPLPRVSRRARVVASSVDIVPTLLELLNLPIPPEVRGRSLVPALYGADRQGRTAYLEERLTQYGPYDLRGLRTDTHKYVATFRSGKSTQRADELFDLEADPGEENNLVEARPELAKALRSRLERLIEEAEVSAPPVVPKTVADKETREALEALGYIGN